MRFALMIEPQQDVTWSTHVEIAQRAEAAGFEILYHWAFDRLGLVVSVRTWVRREAPEIESIAVPSYEPRGPYGAKEVGEGGIMPTIPAILNAIYDATGVVIDELPASPERILAGLHKDTPR